jgi:hypothetical protein
MTISGTIEQAPTNAYYFTDIQTNDILFRAFQGTSYCFGAGSNVPCMMRVNSNNITMNPIGNVGIGTSNPQTHLHVYNASSAPTFMLDGGGFGNRGTLRFASTNAGNIIQSGSQFSNDSRADIIFTSMSGTTEHMRIRGVSGNVGIGVNNPQSKLEVAGTTVTTSLQTSSISTSNITAASASSCNINIGCDSTTSAVNIACGANNQTVNIGTGVTGQTTINIGGPSDIINISGNLQSIQTTDIAITDKSITLNKGGLVNTGDGVGFEIEENNNITGYIKTDTTRGAFLFKTPLATADFNIDLTGNSIKMNANTLVLANGGNIGVGTSSPLSKLHVSTGDITISHSFGQCAMRLLPSGDTSTRSYIVRGNNDNMEIESVSSSTGRMRFLVGSNTGITQEAMSVTHGGRVGISTSNPQTILDVNGAIRGNGVIVCFNSNNTAEGGQITLGYANRNLFSESNGSWSIDVSNSNLRLFSTNASATTTVAMNITENGNIVFPLANNQTPATKLDVYGTTTIRGGTTVANPSNNQLVFSPSNADYNKHAIRTRHGAADDTNNAIDFYVWQQSQLTTATGNKHIMSITNQGVGVGTSNPAYTLDIVGSLRSSSLSYINRASAYCGYWRLSSNITHNNGTSLMVTRAGWSNAASLSFNSSNMMDVDGSLIAPVAGIYTAVLAMRFPLEQQNQCWFEHDNTLDRLAWTVNNSSIYNVSWTGFLDSNWKLRPTMWQGTGSNVTYNLASEIVKPFITFTLNQAFA